MPIGVYIRSDQEKKRLKEQISKFRPIRHAKDRYINAHGYYTCFKNGKNILEHRSIAEKVLGRKLKSNEVIHHINGNKQDNRNCNLIVCTKEYHLQLHQRMSFLYAREKFGDKRITIKA